MISWRSRRCVTVDVLRESRVRCSLEGQMATFPSFVVLVFVLV